MAVVKKNVDEVFTEFDNLVDELVDDNVTCMLIKGKARELAYAAMDEGVAMAHDSTALDRKVLEDYQDND